MVQPDESLPGNDKPEMIQRRTQFHKLASRKEEILKLFPVQAAPSDTLAFFSHCEKIFLGVSEFSTFSAQFFCTSVLTEEQ